MVSGRGPLVVTPTLNERESIAAHVEDIFHAVPGISVLIMDDASEDGTPEIVRSLQGRFPNLQLLTRSGPRSFAGSYCDGLHWGIENRFDPLISMDADRSHPPEAIPDLLEAAKSADLVVASRYLHGVSVRNWPLRRVLLSAFANRYAHRITSVPSSDLTSGFCLYRADLIRSLDLHSFFTSGYAFLIEMKYRAWRTGARLQEVPYTFVERRSGKSKLKWTRILEGIVAPVWCRVRLGRLPAAFRRRLTVDPTERFQIRGAGVRRTP